MMQQGDDEMEELVAHLLPKVEARLKALYAEIHNDPNRFKQNCVIGSNAALARAHLSQREPHDPDYAVFRHVGGDDGIIIDVGANSGQSAASIWAAGSGAAVLSFEALHFHREALEAIKSIRPGHFEYRLVALSDCNSELEFLIPVAFGHGATWLATVSNNIDWPKLAATLTLFMVRKHYHAGMPINVDLNFVRTIARRLDDLIDGELKDVSSMGIAAIKIDVEGHETEVIRGAVETVAKHRPLLLIERAQNRLALLKDLQSMGYKFGARVLDQIVATDQPNVGRNTFFWHTSREDEYRHSGLLRQSV